MNLCNLRGDLINLTGKTIHLVANSHIDPVWLWDKYEGIDEVINTFRSACDRLDEYPELKFSASSICFYKWVEEYAPDVFERIRAHVLAGCWEITGGWLVEMDCNLPSAESFYKSSEISKAYIASRFGADTPVAYSPDSFGHAATLPEIKVNWVERRCLLKLEIEPNFGFDSLLIQGPGAEIIKKTNRNEEPMHGWILAGKLGIIQSGAFAFDRYDNTLRLTLVRSSLYGYDQCWTLDPFGPLDDTDLGEHKFRIRFIHHKDPDSTIMDRLCVAFLEPFHVIRSNF